MHDATFDAIPVGRGVSGMWDMRDAPRFRRRSPIVALCMSRLATPPRRTTAPPPGARRYPRRLRAGRSRSRPPRPARKPGGTAPWMPSAGIPAPRPLARRHGTPPNSLNGIRLIHISRDDRGRAGFRSEAQAKRLNSLRTPRDAWSRGAVQPGVAVLSSDVKLSAGHLFRRQYPKWALARFFYV